MPKYNPTINDRKVISFYLNNRPLYGYNLDSSMKLESVPVIEKATFIAIHPMVIEKISESVYSTEDVFSECLDKFTLAELGINGLTMEHEG